MEFYLLQKIINISVITQLFTSNTVMERKYLIRNYKVATKATVKTHLFTTENNCGLEGN